jgi:glutathione S-transferase
MDEIKRILGVLDKSLEGKKWLVGDKMTYADMAFVPYNSILHLFMECEPGNALRDYPNVGSWHRSMTSRASWQKVTELKATITINA